MQVSNLGTLVGGGAAHGEGQVERRKRRAGGTPRPPPGLVERAGVPGREERHRLCVHGAVGERCASVGGGTPSAHNQTLVQAVK